MTAGLLGSGKVWERGGKGERGGGGGGVGGGGEDVLVVSRPGPQT